MKIILHDVKHKIKLLKLPIAKMGSLSYTQAFANRITEKLIDDLSDKRYNLIIEGTLRTSEVPLKTQALLAEKGYSVELAVMAVSKADSWKGVKERYKQMQAIGMTPRMTPKEKHDEAIKSIPHNLDSLYKSGKFDNIKLFDRKGKCRYCLSETPQKNPYKIISKAINKEAGYEH